MITLAISGLVFVLAPPTLADTGADILPECIKWFGRNSSKISGNCEWSCAMFPIGMGNFACGNDCSKLCKLFESRSADGLDDYYEPYLNTEELKLVSRNPKESWKVYQMKNEAEKMTIKNFGGSYQDDESDAFRHFVWAALLSKEIGNEKALIYLNAHESAEDQNSPSRAMDLANNRNGLLKAAELLTQKHLTQDWIEKAGLEALKNKSMVVLKVLRRPK